MSSGPFSLAVGDSQEIVVALVAGLGTSNLNSITVLRANDMIAQAFYDSLNGIMTDVKNDFLQVPCQFGLRQNYPNPFNPSTKIGFRLQASGLTSLRVHDLLGREVATLVNELKTPGEYEVTWDASCFPSGVYFYRLTSGSFVETRKLVVLR
jgi:hypothetical protein